MLGVPGRAACATSMTSSAMSSFPCAPHLAADRVVSRTCAKPAWQVDRFWQDSRDPRRPSQRVAGCFGCCCSQSATSSGREKINCPSCICGAYIFSYRVLQKDSVHVDMSTCQRLLINAMLFLCLTVESCEEPGRVYSRFFHVDI